MVPWETIQTALKSLVASLTGLAQVQWFDERLPFVAAQSTQFAVARLQVFAVSSVGTWDDRQLQTGAWLDGVFTGEAVGEDNDGPLYESIRGQRTFTLRVSVESYDQTPGRTARQYLETLRDRLQRASVSTILAQLALGLGEVLMLRDTSDLVDDHAVSKAVFDVRLHLGTTDTDTTEYERIEGADAPTLDPSL